ncbi:hypothetical protein N7490_002665 [Penicillium lividum]|nr:hypothetical protein N7490_002665 [Penicillium lividum]
MLWFNDNSGSFDSGTTVRSNVEYDTSSSGQIRRDETTPIITLGSYHRTHTPLRSHQRSDSGYQEEDMSSMSEDSLRKLLSYQQEGSDKISQLVEAAAINEFNGDKLMRILFDQKGHEIQITLNIVLVAVANERLGGALIELFLSRRGHEIQITDEILEAAENNKKTGQQVLGLLRSAKKTIED